MLGVSSVVLRAAGCSFPKPPAELISLWALDETSQTGGVFDDLGAADVPMAMVGTWTDLTTPSMVQDVGGTSAYTDGSGYATIAANDPAHDLAALTISFYYQRNSATAKQTLLAAGNGFGTGDFSIEVLADGKLRGYHVGQDGALRFFEDTSGITGTDLQVGTAHRIDLTLGPQGARIYLDGAELAAAAIFANRNSWNNARVKYLGCWTDGIQGSADGVFDRFRIWNQQLTNGEIELLEPAQSIEIGGAPPTGDELSVPSLAEWLTNDDTDPPPGATIVTSASALTSALGSASPGATIVADPPGGNGTIGFWDLPNGLNCPNGTASNPITLMAARNKGIVVSRSEQFAEFRTTGQGNWTQSGLSQADIDKKIWRSTSTFSNPDDQLMGFWVEFDHPHQMVRCGSMTNLRATYGTADSPTNYSGPQARLHSDGRVYTRMQKPHPDKYSKNGKWSGREWPGHRESYSNGVINYPVREDPNDYVIHLFRAGFTSGATIAFDLGASGNHFKIGEGINSLGHGRVARGSNVTIRRGTHLTWRYGAFFSPNGGPDHEDWDVQRARFSDGSKIHLSRHEWKFGGWSEDIRSGFAYTQSGDLGRNSRRIFFKNCTIADFHELQLGGDEQFRYRNCAMFHIFDDGIQSPQNLSRVEIGYCYFRGSAFGGSGQGGTEADDPNPGEWFIHHNIFDNRENRGTNWNAEPHPQPMYIQHSPDHDQPRKYYNCAMFAGPDLENEIHLGYSSNSDRDNTADKAHEVFNMIVIRQDNQRYNPQTGYSNQPGDDQSDYHVRYYNCSANLSNEYWDYNLYYREVPNPVDPWGRQVREGRGVNEQNFSTLNAFRASALFTLSRSGGTRRGAYTPGFEANSTQAEPDLPSLNDFPSNRFSYRPSPTSAVTTATTSSLSGENWWSGLGPSWGRVFPWNDGEMTLQPSGYKGALDPNGSTMPVGVQNP